MNAEYGEWEMEKQNNRKLKQLSKLSGMLDRLRTLCAQRVSKCPKCGRLSVWLCWPHGRNSLCSTSLQSIGVGCPNCPKQSRLSAMLYWPHGQNIGVQSGWRGAGMSGMFNDQGPNYYSTEESQNSSRCPLLN